MGRLKFAKEKSLKTRICIVGAGYVGLANALVLSRRYDITLVENNSERFKLLTKGVCPLNETEMHTEFKENFAKFSFIKEIVGDEYCDIFILALPTNFDDQFNKFDTFALDNVIQKLSKICSKQAKSPIVVIKSTVPIGYTEQKQSEFPELSLVYSPEFLREGSALKDASEPSRTVLGSKDASALECIEKLYISVAKQNMPVCRMSTSEAESCKLFANAYLAMRVAYFNEIDSFCMLNGMNTEAIIQSMGYDERIGEGYCNPSFGYGGYCFPKDTKQLLANFDCVPQSLISAIVSSNQTRMNLIAQHIKIRIKAGKKVGFDGLAMKSGSDNIRSSAGLEIMMQVCKEGQIFLYEPLFDEAKNIVKMSSREQLYKQCDVVIVNRKLSVPQDFAGEIFTRDIFEVS